MLSFWNLPCVLFCSLVFRSSKYNLGTKTNVGNTQNQEVEKKINSSELVNHEIASDYSRCFNWFFLDYFFNKITLLYVQDSEVNLCQNNILTQQGIRFCFDMCISFSLLMRIKTDWFIFCNRSATLASTDSSSEEEVPPSEASVVPLDASPVAGMMHRQPWIANQFG